MATELYELRISGNHTTEYWENVLHFRGSNLSAGDVIVNARDLLDSFEASAQSAFCDLLPSTAAVNRLTAKRVDVGGGIEVVKQFQIGDSPGAVSGGASAQQLCPCIRLIPPMGTKSAGRFFLPCIAEADIENNAPQAGWITNLGALMTILLANFGTGTIEWQLAIYSRKNDSYTLALGYDTSPIVGWQRRRQRPF